MLYTHTIYKCIYYVYIHTRGLLFVLIDAFNFHLNIVKLCQFLYLFSTFQYCQNFKNNCMFRTLNHFIIFYAMLYFEGRKFCSFCIIILMHSQNTQTWYIYIYYKNIPKSPLYTPLGIICSLYKKTACFES